MSFTEELLGTLEDHRNELREELGRLDGAIEALGGVARTRATNRRTRVQLRDTKPRDNEEVAELLDNDQELTGALLRLPPSPTRVIAKEIGRDAGSVLKALRALERAGLVRREGERAATRWTLVGP